ncbi:hypothetical protein BDN70DRAFT_91074 [Pholiota conissans]|uniref:Cysteine protease n=1 Tax=Pholiota conissans TaxID=109636 RepID=A0A9P6CSX4_9AGAR|nr:hypothetical protein BDN70DRAFT_91074 [Pholiota conissans]
MASNHGRKQSLAESPGGSSPSPSPEPFGQSPKPRKTSKFLSMTRNRKSSSTPSIPTDSYTSEFGLDYPSNTANAQSPPSSPPQPVSSRTRSERPVASASELQHLQSLYSSTSNTSLVGDLPTRVSGWFAHTFSSSNDLSLPNILAQHGSSPRNNSIGDTSAPSPRKLTGPAALIAAAKHGKGTLDKAMRYLLDSDASPDKCIDPIWLMGVMHPGWEPPEMDDKRLSTSMTEPEIAARKKKETKNGRGRAGSWRSSFGSPAPIEAHSALPSNLNSSQGSSSAKPAPAPLHWPPAFFLDYTSRIWLTYRSQLTTPITNASLADLEPCSILDVGRKAYGGSTNDPGGSQSHSEASESKSLAIIKKPWHWGSAERTWHSDSGWGCMLRTGQSLLANALIGVHLGREWRRPRHPVATADYANYVRILTWFFDTPAPQAPFSVHRMALAGKELGTDVGQWFGPSIAAGAIRTLASSFPECRLGVALATDSTLYQNEIFAASHGDKSLYPRRQHATRWGDRPVLLLLGIRLGLDGVNPIYYDSIKMLYTFPQSVGIAGGRPSSSYYFVGSQNDSLFYLDPHHSRPAIPLRPAPPPTAARQSEPAEQQTKAKTREYYPNRGSISSLRPAPSAPLSPSPLQHRVHSRSSVDSSASSNPAASSGVGGVGAGSVEELEDDGEMEDARSPPPLYEQHAVHRVVAVAPPPEDPPMPPKVILDPVQLHYCNAYSAAEIETFHCDRVRKMPLSGLDPSMLIGFVCRDENDWLDFKKRVAELPKTIFSIENEPPTWPSDSDDDMGFESMSEPEKAETDQEGAEDDTLANVDENEEVDVDADMEHDTQDAGGAK